MICIVLKLRGVAPRTLSTLISRTPLRRIFMQTAQKISSPQSFLISDPRSWNEMFRADNRQETKDSTAVLILQIIKSGHPDTYTILEENAVQISEQRQQIAQLQQELSATQRQLTSSQQTISNLQSQFQRAEEGRLSALEQIEELRLQLTAAQIAADATATAAAQTTPDGASASDQESGISEEEFVNLQAQAEELAVVAARYEQVLTNYQQYALLEDRILAETTSQTLVQGRNTMNTFFSTPEVADIMPGMQDRIDRYITAAGELGTTEVLFNASDIVDGALRIQDVGVRDRYFVDLLGRYQDNEGMTEFIQTLQRTLP